VIECGLKQIAKAQLRKSWYQPALGLGSIEMTPTDAGGTELSWDHVARPEEVYEILSRATRKAQ